MGENTVDQIFIEIVSRDGIKKLTRPVPRLPQSRPAITPKMSSHPVPGRDGTGPASRGALVATNRFGGTRINTSSIPCSIEHYERWKWSSSLRWASSSEIFMNILYNFIRNNLLDIPSRSPFIADKVCLRQILTNWWKQKVGWCHSKIFCPLASTQNFLLLLLKATLMTLIW